MVVKDHFNSYAADYRRNRPKYPSKLFRFLSSLVSRKNRVWDCATGNGQAAIGLAEYFKEIIATDVSAKQIENGTSHSNINYVITMAEESGLENDSVGLVTVAQALHWFKTDKFYIEVRRVLKEEGIIAVWCYDRLSATPEVDAVINVFHKNILREYWFPERRHIESGYSTLMFPFPRIETPEFSMVAHWDLLAMIGYLKTWSAVNNYIEREQVDPINLIQADLESAWGNPTEVKIVNWPLTLKVGKFYTG